MASSSVALGNEGRRLEGSCDPRVKSNSSIVVLLEPFVSISTPLGYPLFERLADSSVDDVTDVRSGHLPNLSQNRQRIDDVSVSKPKVKNEVELEIFVLRNIDDVNIITKDRLYPRKINQVMVKNVPSSFH